MKLTFKIMPIEVSSDRDSIYLTIDVAKGNKLNKKIEMSKKYPIKEGSTIRMSTSEDVFFVE